MNKLSYFTVFLIVIASVIVFFGALAKLEHWAIANPLLSLGIVLELLCVLLLLFIFVFRSLQKK